ncbi:MAG: tetratricopeptide repeat protein [Hyphomicrobiales bacterium]
MCPFIPSAAGEVLMVQAAPEKKPQTPAEFKTQQAELLKSLFERLTNADDERTAKILEQAVWQVWLRSGSETIDILMQQSIKAMNDQRPDVALGILDAVVELAPKYAEGWNKRATVLFTMRQFEASLRDIDKVLDLEPRHFGALSGQGLIKRAQKDDKGALEAYRRALDIHPFLTGARQAVKELREAVEGKGI